MSVFVGSFLGFTYDGKHSSEFGIVRTSNGSRFDENLLPTQSNRTVTIPGRDETYYFGGDDTQKQFTVSFAFDCVTPKKLEALRNLLANKAIRDLEFDERKEIVWKAKVTSSSIKYIPFDAPSDMTFEEEEYAEDAEEKIIYKGEGTIQFTCYTPYGIKKTSYSGMTRGLSNDINNGALEADWELWIPFAQYSLTIDADVTIGGSTFHVHAKPSASDKVSDVGVVINSKSGFLQGYYGDNFKKSGNSYVSSLSGTISKIPVGAPLGCQISGTYGMNWRMNCESKYY